MPLKLGVPLPSKGLMVDRPGEYVDSRSAFAIKNMEFNRSIIRKRGGTLALGSSLGERVQRFFELQTGASTRLFRVGLTKVEVINKSTSVWSSVAHAVLTGAVTDQVSYAFPVLSGTRIVTFTNGKDAIRKCSAAGNDADLGGTPPLAKYLLAAGNYLLLANVTDAGTSYPSRVQWPDIGAPESWTPGSGSNAGSKDLLDDPEDISGVGLFASLPTIHKPHSIYVGQLVTTSAVWRFDRKATGVGTIASATVQSLPSGEQIFLAADGLHLFNGITAPPIESPMNDEIREEINLSYAYKAQSVFVADVDEYWVCLPLGSDTEPQTVYKYNWKTKQIYKDSRTNLTALNVYINTTETTWADKTGMWDSDSDVWNGQGNSASNPIIIFGDSAGVTTKRSSSTNNDNGTAIEGSFDTKDFTNEDLGGKDMDRMVRWKGLQMWAKGNTVRLYYSIDGGSTWVQSSTLTLGSDYPSDSSPEVAYFDVVSSRIRFRFYNAVLAETFTIKKYEIMATEREARK